MPINERVFIAGGAGFVGRHVGRKFAARGYDVVVAGRHPPTSPSSARFVHFDLTDDPETLATTLAAENPAVVVGAVGSIWSRTDAEMWSETATPALRLLEAMALVPDRPRLVHLGSVLEYGPAHPGTTIGAGTVARPTSAYGRAKLAATEAVRAASRDGWLDAMVLRIANVVGPGTPAVSLLGRVVTELRRAAERRETAVIELDPLRAHRDYVDVRDVADAVVAGARASIVGKVVDIGRGQAVPVRYLVDLLVDVSGVPARVVERDDPVPAGPPPPPDWLQVDIGPADALLGWSPRRSIEDAVRTLWLDDGQVCRPGSPVALPPYSSWPP